VWRRWEVRCVISRSSGGVFVGNYDDDGGFLPYLRATLDSVSTTARDRTDELPLPNSGGISGVI
jgi:hypothetical protein